MPKKKPDAPQKSAETPSTTVGRSGSFQVRQEPVSHGKREEDVHKFEVTRPPAEDTAPELIKGEAQKQPGTPEEQPKYEDLGQLSETYGSKTLYMVARDPHWLFLYWDVDWSEFPARKMQGGERHVFLKVQNASGEEAAAVEVNPDARSWYVQVDKAATTYEGELGFYDPQGRWSSIVRSGRATTPADALAEDALAEFATVPFHLTFERLVEMVRETMAEGETLIQALARLQGEGQQIAFAPGVAPTWSLEQKRVLAALLGNDAVETVAMGSAEIDQLLRKQLQERLGAESSSGLSSAGRLIELLGGEAGGSESSSLSSGFGFGASWSAQPFSTQKDRGFFMHVNAEIIFYGGTHPDATVWVDGEQIHLNPDGTFRYHFKFQEGDFEVPIVARSPDGLEERAAVLSFKRATAKRGDVANTGQPPNLQPLIGQKG